MLYTNFVSVILASGKNTRMLSGIPKVMHKIAGKYMLQYLIDASFNIGIKSVYIVYNKKFDCIKNVINTDIINHRISHRIFWIAQSECLGTGHAIQQVLSTIKKIKNILVLYGDVPLISKSTLKKLCDIQFQYDIGLVTAKLIDPTGYGRIVRNKVGSIIDIIEDRNINANSYLKNIIEINTGIFIATIKNLKIWVNELSMRENEKEFYLTDIVNIAYRNGYSIGSVQPIDTLEIMGVNSILDLVNLEREYQKKQVKELLLSGITIIDPNRFDLRGTLSFGSDVYIDINVIIEGEVSLGNRVHIGANCILKNVIISDDVCIHPFSVIESTKIDKNSSVGPFARLRPGTKLYKDSCVGNFVELKNTQLGTQSKVSHLSYIGDTEIGSQVNIGAGVIVCNYDGVKKNRTTIGNNVFIGSDSQLIAPINIASNAVIGAGTTVVKDVLQGETVISKIRKFSVLDKKNNDK